MYSVNALLASVSFLTSAWRRFSFSVPPSALSSSSANEDRPPFASDGDCIIADLERSPFNVFSPNITWKLSFSSISLALVMRVSIKVFSNSWWRPPPWFSISTILIWPSASSSRKDSINWSFCITSLDVLFESLRFIDDGSGAIANCLSASELSSRLKVRPLHD